MRGQELTKVLSRCGAKVVSLDIMLSCRAVCEGAPGKAYKLSQDKRGLQDLRASWKTGI